MNDGHRRPLRPVRARSSRILRVAIAAALAAASSVAFGSVPVSAAATTALTVTQAAPTGTFAVGETLTYSITVTNPGDDPVNAITLSDPLASTVSCPATSLAANTSMTCTASVTITQAQFDAGKIDNTATANGTVTQACTAELLTPVLGAQSAYTFADRGVGTTEIGNQKEIKLVDSAGRTVATYYVITEMTGSVYTFNLSGQQVNWEYGAGNTAFVPDGIFLGIIELVAAPGATISAGSNIFDARGSTMASGKWNDIDGYQTDLSGAMTTATLVYETVDTDIVGLSIGDQFVQGTYYSQTNPTITLAQAPGFQVEYAHTAMTGGDSASFTFNRYADTAQASENNALNLTTYGCLATTAPVTGTSTQTTNLWQPELTVVKTGPTGTLAVGQTVTYSIAATNTGNVDLASLTISDPLTSNEACPVTTLAVGASTTCTASYVVKQADVDNGSLSNTASVTGTLPDGVTKTSGTDTVTASITRSPAMTVTKTATNPGLGTGSSINYSIVVTNTGNVTLSSIAIDDPLTTNESCPGTTLAVGASMTCTATYTITTADATNGTVDNTATITASDPGGATITETGTNSYTVVPNFDLSIAKTDNIDPVVVGGDISWNITVSNAGPNTATGVTITDNIPADVIGVTVTGCTWSGTDCVVGDLAANQSATITIAGSVDPAIVGTTITNTATVASSGGTDTNSANNTSTAVTTVDKSADLVLIKSSSPSPFVPGGQVTYTLTVHNNGPSGASNLAVTDTLPAGLTNIATTTSGCTVTGSTVDCSFAALAVDATQTVTITADSDPGLTSALTNTASVTADEFDPNTANNSGTNVNGADPRADLRVSKVALDSSVVAGNTIEYRVTVTNLGPSTAANVTVTDTMTPALMGVSLVGDPTIVSGATGTCTTTQCDIPTLAAGQSSVISYIVDVPGDVAGGQTLTNTAAATAETPPDPDSANSSVTVNTPITAAADLSVTKFAAGPMTPGTQQTYTVTVYNNGPSTVGGSSVTDQLDPMLTFDPANSSGLCSDSAGTVTCVVGTLAAGQSQTFTIAVDVDPSLVEPVQNSATVTEDPNAPDPDLTNNTATDTAGVLGEADLGLTKTVKPGTYAAGTNAVWTLAVRNNGPSDAINVVVADVVPAPLTVVSVSPAGICGAGDITNCQIGDIAAGSTTTITVTTAIPADAAAQSITNSASVTSDTPDSNTANDTASKSITTTVVADIDVAKTASPNPHTPGDQVTFTIAAHSAGPSNATAVEVVDVLDSSMTIASANVTSGATNATCDVTAAPTITCTGDVAAGATMIVELVVDTNPAVLGTLSNTGQVSPGVAYTDPDTSNNSATIALLSTPKADLAVSKTTTSGQTVPGTELTWTVVATNAGPSLAVSTIVADDLPPELIFVSAVPEVGTCSHSGEAVGGTVTCDMGDLAIGAVVSIDITTKVAASTADAVTIANNVSIGSRLEDNDLTNNSARATVDTNRVAMLTLLKSASPSPIVAGNNVTWTLTAANAGPSDAAAVTLADTLPTGFTLVSATTTAGTCNTAATPDITCDLGTIAAGATPVTVTIVATAAAGFDVATGPVVNSASVTSPDHVDPVTATSSTPITASADLVVDKTATAQVTSGGSISWTITATNAGPSNAAGVVINDTIPDGVTVDPADITGTGCTLTGSDLTCDSGTLAPTESAVVTIVGTVEAAFFDLGYSSPLTNTARATSDVADPNATNSTASADTVVTDTADLSLTKSAEPAVVTAGGTVTWTLTALNAGPDVARGVVVSDPLPAGFTATSATASNGDICNLAVTCDIGILAVDDPVTITIVGSISTDAPAGPIDNSATISSLSTDPTPNEPAAATVEVQTAADLAVTKTGPATAVAGESVTYTIVVANAGPSDALDVVLTESVPAALQFVNITATQGSCMAATCTLGTIAHDASATVTVTGTIDPDAVETSIANTASVTSSTDDPDTTNNSDTVDTAVTTAADLSVVKLDLEDLVVAGDNLTWRIEVDNHGPSTARNVVVTDVLPEGAVLVSAEGCTGTTTLTCSFGDIANGAAAAVEVTVAVIADYYAMDYSNPMWNTTTIASDTADPDTSNNSFTQTTTIAFQAALAIAKDTDAITVAAGDSVVWDITVLNSGTSVATDVVVTDTLPEGTIMLSAVPTSGSCSVSASTLTCDLGNVGVDEYRHITVETTLDPDYFGGELPSALTNTVSVASPTPDPEPADNTASAFVGVVELADLNLAKDGPMSIVAGEEVTWTLTVINAGSSIARGVTLTDQLPTGVSFVSATAEPPATCGVGVVCDLGDIAPDQMYTITIVGKVDPSWSLLSYPSSMTNTARLSSPTPDANYMNNASSMTTKVTSSVTLTSEKLSKNNYALAGGLVQWSVVVTNTGPSTASDVTVVDPIPAGVTLTGVSASDGSTCLAIVECTIETIAPDTSVTISIVGRLDASWFIDGRPPSLTNTALVTSPTTEPLNPVVTIFVDSEADLWLDKVDVENLVPAGSTVEWQITTHNVGPSDAAGVMVVDELPDGLDLTTLTSDGTDCKLDTTGTPAEYTCNLGTLAPASATVINLSAKVNSSYFVDGETTPMRNSAFVLSETWDPDSENDFVYESTQIANDTGVAIAKAVSSPVVAGLPVTWTIDVVNTGISDSENVAVSDLVPAGIAVTSVATTQGTCTPTPLESTETQLDCALGTVVAGTPVAITIVGTVSAQWVADSRGDLANTATVSTTSPDPTNDNVATATATVSDRADLVIDKSVAADSGADFVHAGESLTWTIDLTNDGPSVSRDVVITDSIPAGVTVDSVDPACPIEGLTMTCEPFNLAPGDTHTVTIKATVDADYLNAGYPTPLVNSATAESATADATPAGTDVMIDVVAVADLGLKKTPDAEQAVAGTNVTWTLAAKNAGPSDATDVVLADELPAGVTLKSITIESGDAECDLTITCTLAVLPAHETAVITIAATVDAGYVVDIGDPLINSATLTSASDPYPDPPALATTDIVASADLSLTKVDLADPVVAGEAIEWQLDVTNQGPSTATAVAVTDVIPDGFTVTNVVASDGSTCTTDVACVISRLKPDETVTVTIKADVAADWFAAGGNPAATNTASVTGAQPDPDSENNSASEGTTIAAQSGISIGKDVNRERLVAGEAVRYFLSVRNAGPSVAEGVTVTDQLPTAITNIKISAPSGVTCTTDAAPVCTIASIEPGGRVVIMIDGTVAATTAATPALVNTATITSTTTDPTPDDNTASVSAPVVTSADVSLTKSVTGPVVAGGQVTWTLVASSKGPSVARDVVVNDSIPAGLKVVSVTAGTGVKCTNAVKCQVGTLLPGQNTTIKVVTTMPPDPAGVSIKNTATVASSTPDPAPKTNTATATASTLSATVGLAKRVIGKPTINADGSVTVAWRLKVVNDGKSPLNKLQVIDDVATQLHSQGTFTVDSVSSSTFTVNKAYDGTTDVNLLAGTDQLAPGAMGEIDLKITLTFITTDTTVSNSAKVEAVTSTGVAVGDMSTSGSNPDGDGDGSSSDDNIATTFTVEMKPSLGVAKHVAGEPVLNKDQTVSITWVIEVVNGGPVNLMGIQIDEPLNVTLAGAKSFRVVDVSSSTLTVNPAFDGVSNTQLLTGSDGLKPNRGGVVKLVVAIAPGQLESDFANQVIGHAVDHDGTELSDLSDSGTFGCEKDRCDTYDAGSLHPDAADDTGTNSDMTSLVVKVPADFLPASGANSDRLARLGMLFVALGLFAWFAARPRRHRLL